MAQRAWILRVKAAMKETFVIHFVACLETSPDNAVFRARYGGRRVDDDEDLESQGSSAGVVDLQDVAVKMSLASSADDTAEERTLERVQGLPSLQQLVDRFYLPELRAKVHLTEFVDTSTPLDVGSFVAVQSYARQLLEAIAKLHSLSLIHRDIKEGNVLFNGETNELVVIDFDSTYEKYNIVKPSRGKLPKGRIGTTGYFAPEILPSRIRKHRTGYTHKVDIWSAGILLGNHVLKVPGTGFLDKSELRKRIDAGLALGDDLNPHLSSALDLLSGMLCVDPEVRWEAKDCLKHPFFH